MPPCRGDWCYRIFAAMAQQPHPQPQPSPAPAQAPARPILTLSRLGWALAAWFIVLTGILLTHTNRLSGDLARSRDRVTILSRDLAAERRWSTILSSTSMRTASFTLTPDADAGLRARAVMDPVSRRAVLVLENFQAPGGKRYELWALHGNTPATLGPIRTDARGNAVLRIEDVGDPSDLSAFAISLEPDAGAGTPPAPDAGSALPGAAREPTGPIVMIGSLGR
jgi:hypothetical protein